MQVYLQIFLYDITDKFQVQLTLEEDIALKLEMPKLHTIITRTMSVGTNSKYLLNKKKFIF